MPEMPIARHGDTIEHEDGSTGTIVATAVLTYVNNIPIARVGDTCSEHEDGKLLIAGSSITVSAENQNVARIGTTTDCDSPGVVVSGSLDSFVGD